MQPSALLSARSRLSVELLAPATTLEMPVAA
jgi:hypothetical protein